MRLPTTDMSRSDMSNHLRPVLSHDLGAGALNGFVDRHDEGEIEADAGTRQYRAGIAMKCFVAYDNALARFEPGDRLIEKRAEFVSEKVENVRVIDGLVDCTSTRISCRHKRISEILDVEVP